MNRRELLFQVAVAPVILKEVVKQGWGSVTEVSMGGPGEAIASVGWTEIQTVRMDRSQWIKGTISRGDELTELFYRADPASVPILRATAPNRLFGVELNENGEAV